MAATQIPCPKCRRALKAPAECAGQPVCCPLCRAVFTAPARPADGRRTAAPPGARCQAGLRDAARRLRVTVGLEFFLSLPVIVIGCLVAPHSPSISLVSAAGVGLVFVLLWRIRVGLRALEELRNLPAAQLASFLAVVAALPALAVAGVSFVAVAVAGANNETGVFLLVALATLIAASLTVYSGLAAGFKTRAVLRDPEVRRAFR
jgi:hypothetical protein